MWGKAEGLREVKLECGDERGSLISEGKGRPRDGMQCIGMCWMLLQLNAYM